MSIRKSVIALALAVPFASAFSMDLAIAKSIPLTDGSVVHQFMNVGETMAAADGTTITANSDEVALLSSVIRDHYGRTTK